MSAVDDILAQIPMAQLADQLGTDTQTDGQAIVHNIFGDNTKRDPSGRPPRRTGRPARPRSAFLTS